jgi:hypothetical protein
MSFLPGMFPAGAAGVIAPPQLTSVSNVATASSTSSTITWPAVQAGDMAILFDFANGLKKAPTAVTPSGFTNMCNGTGLVLYRGMASFKLCTGSESGSITGMNDAVMRKALLILRGNVPFASISGAGGQNGSVVSTNPSAVTVPASGGTPPLLLIGCYQSNGSVDPRTFSTTKDGEAGFHSNQMWIAWKLYTASPADSQIDMDDEGDTNLVQGFYANLTI